MDIKQQLNQLRSEVKDKTWTTHSEIFKQIESLKAIINHDTRKELLREKYEFVIRRLNQQRHSMGNRKKS